MTIVIDPTTTAIETTNDDRDNLRAEVLRLERALAAARTDVEVGNALFVMGYDQAVREIRDHFKKARQDDVVAEVEKIWIKGPSS